MASTEFPEVIELNVAGNMFTTLLSTLTKHDGSILASMFTGETVVHTDKNGRYFLDVDGSTFDVILDYLKFGVSVIGGDFNYTTSQRQNFRPDDIERLHASALALGLNELTQHLEECVPSLGSAERESAQFDGVSSNQLDNALSLNEPTQPSVSTNTTPQIPLFERSESRQKSVSQNASIGQPSAFKLSPGSTFAQPCPQGQVEGISTKKEGFAIGNGSPNLQQKPSHFGKAPEFQSPFGNVENPASIPFGIFGGDSLALTWSSMGPGSPAFSNALISSDGEEPGVKNVAKRHH